MTNALSMFGRLSYGAHMTLYPLIGGSGYFAYAQWAARSAAT